MYGFYISNCPSQRGATALGGGKTLSFGDIQFVYHPMPKFENDKLFYEDEEKILLLDGAILNQRELMKESNLPWKTTVDLLYQNNPETFFQHLRGAFCGAVLNKSTKQIVAFTNQTGEKTVYFTQHGKNIIVASHNNILTEIMRDAGITVEPDLRGLQELLCLRRILHNNTPFRGVSRLMGGEYLTASSCESKIQRYHMFHNIPEHDLTLEECIEELDLRFRKAVDRIFSKNEEYGYQGVCDLSGGLDGRMVTWVAHDLGYRNVLNVCYSQSGTLDHRTSQKIAHDLGNEYYFLPLDGGDILFEMDEIVEKCGGQICSFVCTGANRVFRDIGKRNIGVSATGLIAGEYEATYLRGETHFPAQAISTNEKSSPSSPISKNSISSTYTSLSYSVQEDYHLDYKNDEHMMFYEQDLPLIMNSVFVRQQVTEAVSPYGDVDFLEFAYRIPAQWRKKRGVCMKWIVEKYPDAAKYIYHHAKMPLDKFYRHQIYFPKIMDDMRFLIFRCINKGCRILHIPFQLIHSDEMNPINQWYNTNPAVRKFFNSYFNNHISKIQNTTLRQAVTTSFHNGYAYEKVQALNVLAIYKRYFTV